MANHGLKSKGSLYLDRKLGITYTLNDVLINGGEVLQLNVSIHVFWNKGQNRLPHLLVSKVKIAKVFGDITGSGPQVGEWTLELWDNMSDEERLHHTSNWGFLSQDLIGKAANHTQSTILLASIALVHGSLQIFVQNTVNESQNTHEGMLLAVACKIDKKVDGIGLRRVEVFQRI